MRTLTPEEFKQRYGGLAEEQFKSDERQVGLFESIKNDLSNRAQEDQRLLSQGGTSLGDNITTGFKVAANTAGGIGDVAGEAIKRTPVVGGLLGAAGDAIKGGFNAITDKLGGTKFFQEAAAGLEPGNALENSLSVAQSGGEIAGNILGADVGAGGVKKGLESAAKVPEAVSNIPKPNLGGATKYVKGALGDVLPTTQSLIDHNLAKALDLTPGDLANIESSTGNQVGKWLADNNLIGTNKVTTQGLINGFFRQNYDAVREAIKKVPTIYKINQVPRLFDALKQIEKVVTGVPGLEKTAVEVDNLLNKGALNLGDIQRVKELMDNHFNLYKATGDVAQGAAKEGLANMRSQLRSFIESEVKKNTGEDISSMNNNVATSRTLADAIETRSPRGLTRANFTTRDIMMGLGLTYFTTPLVGLAAVFLKKLATSPTARLRFARYLDKLSDAQRAKISASLKEGSVPVEIQDVVPLDKGVIPPTMQNTQEATLPKELEDLAQEARKYKSAEEFANSQSNKGQVVFRAQTGESGGGLKTSEYGKGTYFFGDYTRAKEFTQGRSGADVVVAEPLKNPLVLDMQKQGVSGIKQEAIDAGLGGTPLKTKLSDAIDFLRDKGNYDGVRVIHGDINGTPMSYEIYKNKPQTTSLTDFYNKVMGITNP